MEKNKYQRMKLKADFGIYTGIDDEGRHSVFVKSKVKPKISSRTKFLETRILLRNDGFWGTTISLNDENLLGVFNTLIHDLASTVEETVSRDSGEEKFMQRYQEWQKLFEILANEILTAPKIIGLVGELYFLKNYMFKEYGVDQSIKSWIGPLGGNKDFLVDDIWFEIKTKSINKDKIHISSNRQLTTDKWGYLVIVNYEKGNILSNESTNIIKLYNEILEEISNENLKNDFNTKLSNINFTPDLEYTKLNFKIISMDMYFVDDEFPRIDDSKIPLEITDIEYSIYLPAIRDRKVKLC